MENCRCNCYGNFNSNWGCGQNQDKCKGYDNYKKDGHKYSCYCWEEKEDCGYGKEKDFSKCGCSHSNNQNQGYNCVCGTKNQGYENYGYGNTNQNNYYGW